MRILQFRENGEGREETQQAGKTQKECELIEGHPSVTWIPPSHLLACHCWQRWEARVLGLAG